MATKIRAELSPKNEYWIEKHRYYELKHFCLQYRSWKKLYVSITADSGNNNDLNRFISTNLIGDPTGNTAIAKSYYSNRIKMLERVAECTDESLAEYILAGVTEGWSYDILKARLNIPCGKDTYYKLYRRFFWLLNRERQ